MSEISVLVLDMDRFTSGLSRYLVISKSNCVAKWWENYGWLHHQVLTKITTFFKIIHSPHKPMGPKNMYDIAQRQLTLDTIY